MKFEQESSGANKLRFSLDFRVITVLLVVVIAVMLVIWKPWSSGGITGRTIEVKGDSTISATPDEFVFYPTYEFKNADKAAALTALGNKSTEIVAKLKELGVPERGIKTDSTGYNSKYLSMPEGSTDTYTLSLTVTVTDESLVQKVQDYLVTTAPTGAVSPQASFSDDKRKALEKTAREMAVNDAKAKADQTAQKLGFKLGKVKAVSDGTGFSILPVERNAVTMTTDSSASLGVHPGENELPYSVTVIYFIR